MLKIKRYVKKSGKGKVEVEMWVQAPNGGGGNKTAQFGGLGGWGWEYIGDGPR